MPQEDAPALEDRIRHLPDQPGVYTFLDGDENPLYIGKAASLEDRVASYLSSSHPARIERMLEQAVDLDTVLVDTEAEAYLLESNLIKEKKPRYNVRLTDDKRYPWILVSGEEHPRIDIVRDKDEDGSYYGPFPDVGTARELVNLLREAFGIRDCPRELPDGCIKHEMGLCMGPCFRDIEDAYLDAVDQVDSVLGGDPEPAIQVLEERMEDASQDLRFEEAARLRDRIEDIEDLLRDQAIFASSREDRDAIAIEGTPERSVAVVLPRRGGRIVDQQTFTLPGHEEDTRDELLEEFLARYYEDRPSIPHRILLQELPSDEDGFQKALSQKAHRAVRFRVPQRGIGKRMLNLAEKNAGYKLARLQQERGPDPGVVDLKERLRLDELPRRIECIDVSHHAGKGRVAGLATFLDGHPEKSGYRRFNLDDEKNDDIHGVREVVRRRLRRLTREGDPLPQVLLIDGGQAQTDAARDEARKLGLEPTILGLAKKQETVHKPGWSHPLGIPTSAPGLKLLQRARDEAHRFALQYGRTKREDQLTTSILDAVPGVGPTLRKRLLKEMGSVSGIQEANVETLESVAGVGPTMARRIKSVVGDDEG